MSSRAASAARARVERPMRPRNAVPRVETASFAQSGSKPRSPLARGWLTACPPLFPAARQATSCTVSSVARPRTTTPASSTSWKKVRNARSRFVVRFGLFARGPDRDRWRARRRPSRRRARAFPRETRDTSPRRPFLRDAPLTRARYAASDADRRAYPPSSPRGLFPASSAASSPRVLRRVFCSTEKTRQATPTARTSSCTTAT